ncbi:MAG TPA: alpha/beta hydrolase domain-containing protein [Solirubrobacteraceae bacterium]|nr:alpha/beta hydrolase domain-containing protein [Solirubrobacteraceae bacterium]
MRGRWTFAGIVIGAALALPGAAAATPLPQVTGPLPVSATSYPFGAADHEGVPEDLSKVGYVEDEYLVSGKANVYDWPTSGPATIRTADAPYTTRVLIRRPAPGKHFSGNVVVEMLNPSNLYDLNIGWAMAHRQIVRNGDAWVGITAKPIDVVALKTFDPARYGSLSFANPLPLSDPRNCTDIQTVVDPPDLRSRATEDGLIWDIYSQVGAWLRSGANSNPLANRVTHAYGFGYSQTGGYLVDYINAINPRVVQTDGKPIYDGYIVAVAGGAFVGGVPLNQCQAAPSATDPRLKFSNVGVPVMRIMSQSDYLFGIDSRQDDSDTPANRLRHYEMAGAAHATPDELEFSAAPADIIRAGRAVPPSSCNDVPRSRFPSRIFFDAALRNLDDWVRNDIAPPRASPIQVDNGAPVLDAFGNVTGGLRSPYVDVPTSTWFGSSAGPGFCFIVGHEVPFTSARLHQLYRNHGQYVSAVARDTARLVAGRFLTSYDGADLVSEAAHAAVP